MSDSFVHRAQQTIGELPLGQLASTWGISEKQTQAGLNSALSAVVVQLGEKSATSAGAAALHQLVLGHADDTHEQLKTLSDGEQLQRFAGAGQQLSETLYGNRLNSAADVLANRIGVDQGVARRLLEMVTPVAVSALKQEVSQQNMDAARLVDLLTERAGAGATAGGLEILAQAIDGSAQSDDASATSDADSAIGKLLPLIGLLALALLAWMFIKGGVEQLPPPASDSAAAQSIEDDVNRPAEAAARQQPSE